MSSAEPAPDADKVLAAKREREMVEQVIWAGFMGHALRSWIPGSPRPEASMQAAKYADDALAEFRKRWPA